MFFCFFRNFMPGRCDVLACAIYCVARAQEGRSSEKNNQTGESDSELLAHKQPFSRGCAIRDLTIMQNRVRQRGRAGRYGEAESLSAGVGPSCRTQPILGRRQSITIVRRSELGLYVFPVRSFSTELF